jgi:hypothetical protein
MKGIEMSLALVLVNIFQRLKYLLLVHLVIVLNYKTSFQLAKCRFYKEKSETEKTKTVFFEKFGIIIRIIWFLDKLYSNSSLTGEKRVFIEILSKFDIDNRNLMLI